MKFVVIFTLLMSTFVLQAREASDKPNIIFILIDDLGKEWLSCYGGDDIKTPQIDKLAEQGVKFNNAYSMPQCTPSRACFLTGQYPFRNGWVNHWDSPRWGVGYFDWNLNPSIARTMQSAGYKTAVAGKWQLNDFRLQPDALPKHGFDDFCMWTGCEGSKDKKHMKVSTQRYWDPYIFTKEGSKTHKGKFGPDIYNDFVLDFIDKNQQKPFFIYYPMALTHGPLVHTPHEMNVTSKLDKHKAMVRYTDYLLGKIMKKVDDLGIRKNTIIVWTCDNGTSARITNSRQGRSVRGGKTQTTENGVNTPFIVSCPGLVPQNKESNALVDFTDMHKTFAAFAGAQLDSKYTYDGYSQKEVFLGEKKDSRRPWIMAMGANPAKLTEKGVENVYFFRDRVIREKRYKLFVSGAGKAKKLVDVIKDPDEKTTLINNPEYKAVLQRLSAVIETFPKQDNDPKYKVLATNEWDKKVNEKSMVHKIGHPGNPAPVVTYVKKKKSKKKQK